MDIFKDPSVSLSGSTCGLSLCPHHTVTSFFADWPTRRMCLESQDIVTVCPVLLLSSLVDVFSIPKSKVVGAGSTILYACSWMWERPYLLPLLDTWPVYSGCCRHSIIYCFWFSAYSIFWKLGSKARGDVLLITYCFTNATNMDLRSPCGWVHLASWNIASQAIQRSQASENSRRNEKEKDFICLACSNFLYHWLKSTPLGVNSCSLLSCIIHSFGWHIIIAA